MFTRLFKKEETPEEKLRNQQHSGRYKWNGPYRDISMTFDMMNQQNVNDFLLGKIGAEEFIRLDNEIEKLARETLLRKLDQWESAFFPESNSEDDEHNHFSIKDIKWGVRSYPNEAVSEDE